MSKLPNPALHVDALFAKSQVYIVRALRAHGTNETEEYQLWASLALELLGKAALARIHPALIADPKHFQSLFAACGHQISPDIKTITASTLFPRLGHLSKAFDSRHQTFCEQAALRRNAELHSGESPFTGILADTWEREFWGAVHVVLAMQESTLEEWLGVEGAKTPTKIIEQAERAIALAVANRQQRSKDDFESKHGARQRKQAVTGSEHLVWAGDDWDAISRTKCPVCDAIAFLGGNFWNEEIVDETVHYSDDGEMAFPTETVEKTYVAEAFVCLVCGFKLNGAREVLAAKLPGEFVVEEEREREFEPEYGNE